MEYLEESGNWWAWLERRDASLTGVAAETIGNIACSVLDRAYLRPGDIVADLGAGAGLLALKASRAVGPTGKVMAVDSDAVCLEKLEQSMSETGDAGNISAVHADLTDLPLASCSCDAVVSRSALIYASDLGRAVSEMARVLHPGGRYSVFEPLPAELTWKNTASLGPLEATFLEMERVVGEARASGGLDRENLRQEFVLAGLVENQSLAVQYPVIMGGDDEAAIARDYLVDLPGELSTLDIVKRIMSEETAREVAAAFAKLAKAGVVTGHMYGLFAWGRAPDLKTGDV